MDFPTLRTNEDKKLSGLCAARCLHRRDLPIHEVIRRIINFVYLNLFELHLLFNLFRVFVDKLVLCFSVLFQVQTAPSLHYIEEILEI